MILGILLRLRSLASISVLPIPSWAKAQRKLKVYLQGLLVLLLVEFKYP